MTNIFVNSCFTLLIHLLKNRRLPKPFYQREIESIFYKPREQFLKLFERSRTLRNPRKILDFCVLFKNLSPSLKYTEFLDMLKIY